MVGKIKYYIRRLSKMNYKSFLETVNICSKKSKKFKIVILIDLIYCSFRYGAGHLDYRNFNMYELNKKDRNKILTVGRNSSLIRKLNKREFQDIFENKVMFYEKFNKYINRKYLKLDNNYDEFKKFISDKEYIIVKPIDGMCGKGVEKIKVDLRKSKKLYDSLIDKKQILVEEVATQCEEMKKLHENSINTIRIFTIVNDYNEFNVVGTYVRMGNNGKVVDNFNSGGLACPIDIKTGKITHKAVNKKNEFYDVHPVSKVEFIGYQIPKWKSVIKLVEKASKEIKEVRYVGWDVCIGEDGPFLIEANSFPGQDLYQIPKENVGTYNVMLDALNKK